MADSNAMRDRTKAVPQRALRTKQEHIDRPRGYPRRRAAGRAAPRRDGGRCRVCDGERIGPEKVPIAINQAGVSAACLMRRSVSSMPRLT
jgi:hypothetical protein